MPAEHQPPIYVDTRLSAYGGGILRYAQEVIPRLVIPWTAFDGPFKPTQAIDAVNPARARLPRSAVLYNPAYSAGISRCTQLLTIYDLTHLREGSPLRRRLNGAYYRNFVGPAIRRAGHVFTCSETSAEDIRNWVADSRVSVHNTGCGCSEEFSPEGATYDSERPYFLYVGNFKSHKNPGPLFAAMTGFPDHLLVVVSPDVDDARALAEQHGISDRIVIESGVSDQKLATLYRGAEALVFPSRWEGFGLPVLEALKSGAKVVYCQEARSVTEICDGGQFPVANPDDAREFRSQMSAAIESPFRCSTKLDQFQWDAVAAKVESVIRHVAGIPGSDSPK